MNLYNYHSKPESLDFYKELGSLDFYLTRKGGTGGIIGFRDKNNELHRDGDKPAIIGKNIPLETMPLTTSKAPETLSYAFWYKNGALHREGDKPAIIMSNGTEHYYLNEVKYYPEELK